MYICTYTCIYLSAYLSIYVHAYIYAYTCLIISEMIDNNDTKDGREELVLFYYVRYSHYL